MYIFLVPKTYQNSVYILGPRYRSSLILTLIYNVASIKVLQIVKNILITISLIIYLRHVGTFTLRNESVLYEEIIDNKKLCIYIIIILEVKNNLTTYVYFQVR